MRTSFLAAWTFLILIGSTSPAPAEKANPADIWTLMDNGECAKALSLAETADDSDAFLASPEGKTLYGKSICCSYALKQAGDDKEVAKSDLEKALKSLADARALFDPLTRDMGLWLDDAETQCRRTQTALLESGPEEAEQFEERERRTRVIAIYSGKIMGECNGGNLSPAAVPMGDTGGQASWHYIAPPFAGSIDTSGPDKDFQSFLNAAKQDYVGGSPDVEICPPFVALSATQDATQVCVAAQRFTEFFLNRYGARRPPTWITIYHYPQRSPELYEHARRTTGDIDCQGVLGYYDWRRQSVVYGAPPNWFGTFQHELSHALMFWDFPLQPRWLDEGIASLYANTDADFSPEANAWRERILERMNIDAVDLSMFRDWVLRRSAVEFEIGAEPTTLGWKFFRQYDRCGDLPGLYAQMRDDALSSNSIAYNAEDAELTPDDEVLSYWEESLHLHSEAETAPASCP